MSRLLDGSGMVVGCEGYVQDNRERAVRGLRHCVLPIFQHLRTKKRFEPVSSCSRREGEKIVF